MLIPCPVMSLGKNVGALVAARRLSYGDVARAIDTDPQAVWNLVKRKSKRSELAPALAAYFKVPLERLLSDDFDVNETAPTRTPLLDLRIEEAEAIVRLRKAHPDWRRYVLGLAMVDSNHAQELLLTTMRQAVPDYKVEAAYGDAPHVVRERTPLFSTKGNKSEKSEAKAKSKTPR